MEKEMVKEEELKETPSEQKTRFYKLENETYKIPSNVVDEFENDMPDAEEITNIEYGVRKILDKAKTASLVGVTSAAGGTKPKEAYKIGKESLPIIGQTLGGMGGGLPGSVVGASAGRLAQGLLEQYVEDKKLPKTDLDKAIKGFMTSGGVGLSKSKELTEEAATTAVLEAVTRGTSKLLFRKARADDAIKNGVGKVFGAMKETVKSLDESVGVQAEEVINKIGQMTSMVSNKSGPVMELIDKWVPLFRQYADKARKIPPRVLVEFEDNLNDTLKFAKDKDTIKISAKNRAMEVVGKQLRNYMSGLVDNVAVTAGLKEYPTMSKTVSKLFKISGEKQTGKLAALMEGSVLGASVYAATGNPVLAGLTTPALFFSTMPEVQKFLFKTAEKTGIGRTLTIALNEAARKSRKS